jgi:hypothetical protein
VNIKAVLKYSSTKNVFGKYLPLLRDFEVFTAVKIHVEVISVVTPCSVVVGYRLFREVHASSYHNTTQRHN